MKTYLIFFCDKKYEKRESYFLVELKNIGFDNIFCYRKEWLLTTNFYVENKEILDMPRGAGYWLWKPYIIIEMLKKIEEGDIVFYMDAGDSINNYNIINIIKNHMVDNDYMIAGTSKWGLNKYWTKKDCFVLMECDNEIYHNVPQIEAGTLVFKKTKKNEDFLNEWLYYCKNKSILTDVSNTLGNNYDGFNDHRHDQSILTNLIIKYNMKHSDILYSYINYNSY